MIIKYGVYVRVFGQDVNYQIIHVSPCYFLNLRVNLLNENGIRIRDGRWISHLSLYDKQIQMVSTLNEKSKLKHLLK